MSLHSEDWGRLLLNRGFLVEFWNSSPAWALKVSSWMSWGQDGSWGQKVRNVTQSGLPLLASYLASPSSSGVTWAAGSGWFIGCSCCYEERKQVFLPPKVGFNIARRAHLRVSLIYLARSNTWNQMNGMCVLVEGIETDASKLACLVLFLLS